MCAIKDRDCLDNSVQSAKIVIIKKTFPIVQN